MDGLQKNRNLLIGCLILAALPAWSQNPPATGEEYEKVYQWRIRQEFLDGVYIPADLGEAFVQLNRLTDAGSREKFKRMPEADAASKLHFSLGRWIIYNWSFYEGSRLSKYLKDIGLSHPDDMARFLIITYHRHLNQQPLDVKPLIGMLQEKRKEELDQRQKQGEVIYEETRKRPKKADGGNGLP